MNNIELEKLINREISNYSQIEYPLIPKFIGTIKDKNYLITEYIHGDTLMSIKHKELSDKEKYTIIIEIISIIAYLHMRRFIYRDLKPNNIIVDSNKRAFLIDFDRMIKQSYIENNKNITVDFSSEFIAPEIDSGNITYKSDIYSIGKIISFLFFDNINSEVKRNQYTTNIYDIYIKCTKISIDERPTILELMHEFYNKFKAQIDLSIIKNDYNMLFIQDITSNFNETNKKIIKKLFSSYEQYKTQNDSFSEYYLGYMYYEGKYINQDINKAIYYFFLSANNQFAPAQCDLGIIYYEGKHIEQDINKSIHYLTLSANQNYPEAQFYLGLTYYEGKYIKQDIDKAIHYFLLSANQNYPNAQYYLGIIYYEDEYIKQDINKAIHYLTLSANQNYLKAQFYLGIIYYESKHIEQNINKAIHYLTLSANHNYPETQFYLGLTYYEGKYIKQDIDKAIHYFLLSANQNYPNAQYYLGIIYYEDEYIKQDINKAIHYFLLSANQNNQCAQFYLGFSYNEGKNIKQDINKSIYYYTLAANQNNSFALINLALIYYENKNIERDINKYIHYLTLAANLNNQIGQYFIGVYYLYDTSIERDIKKGIYYLEQSSNNGFELANFLIGYLYHEGKLVKRDIHKSIQKYKEASTFNNHRAKNNLGVLYKDGFLDELLPNVGIAISYFEDSIKQKNDIVSMYNLSHIYIYQDQNNKRIKQSIELLIKSSNIGFKPSEELLCIALIKEYGNNIAKIKNELIEHHKQTLHFTNKIIFLIKQRKLTNKTIFDERYKLFEYIDFLYNESTNAIISNNLIENSSKYQQIQICKNLTHDFYEGFSIDF